MIVSVSVPMWVTQCQLESAGPRNWVSFFGVCAHVHICVYTCVSA